MLRLRASVVAAFAVAALAPRSAAAAMSCSITVATSIAFGRYDPFRGAPTDSVGTLALKCTGVTAVDQVTVEINRGSSPTYTARVMYSGKYTLAYNLYLDATRMRIWGDGSQGSMTQTFKPVDGQVTSLNIFGRIPPLQPVAEGYYTDGIVITITY